MCIINNNDFHFPKPVGRTATMPFPLNKYSKHLTCGGSKQDEGKFPTF
jgi:hypothetical protein